jgi:hypothetical protein
MQFISIKFLSIRTSTVKLKNSTYGELIKMAMESRDLHDPLLSSPATAEPNYMQIIGLERNHFLVSGSLGAYKALLYKMSAGYAVVPVCGAVENVETISCGQSEIFLRKLGHYHDRLHVGAIVLNNVQSNVAIGTA